MLGGVGISSILIRALIVLVVFSVFASLVNIIAMTFLGMGTFEDKNTVGDTSQEEGSNINIVLTEDDQALSELYSDDSGSETDDGSSSRIGNNSQNSQKPGNISGNPDLSKSMDLDSLPDLGSFSSTFSSAVDNEEKKTDSEVESGYNKSNSFSSGSRFSAEGLAGTIAEQNKPEDLAKAVKTVLKREETN